MMFAALGCASPASYDRPMLRQMMAERVGDDL
jgi:hypothetical protein